MLVWDNLSGDNGELDYIEFDVYWEVPATGDGFEPDNNAGQAWDHPHNSTSGPRSIDPVGDQDWSSSKPT